MSMPPLPEPEKRLRDIARGVRLYGAPEPSLLAQRLESIADQMLAYGEACAAAAAVAAEREHWVRCSALMLVARSGQITDADLAERLVAMVDEKRA